MKNLSLILILLCGMIGVNAQTYTNITPKKFYFSKYETGKIETFWDYSAKLGHNPALDASNAEGFFKKATTADFTDGYAYFYFNQDAQPQNFTYIETVEGVGNVLKFGDTGHNAGFGGCFFAPVCEQYAGLMRTTMIFRLVGGEKNSNTNANITVGIRNLANEGPDLPALSYSDLATTTVEGKWYKAVVEYNPTYALRMNFAQIIWGDYIEIAQIKFETMTELPEDYTPVKELTKITTEEVGISLQSVDVCANIGYIYDGRYMTLTCETPDVTIHYTTDGTTPTEHSTVYSKPVDTDGITMIKAIAIKKNFFDSKELEYNISDNYDGTEVLIGTPGALSQAFAWTDVNEIRQIVIKGDLGEKDWTALSMLTSLDDLDLSDANTESVPDNALAGLNVRYISMPQSVKIIGKGIFAGSKNLAAIKWNAETELSEIGMQGVANPNLLLYVKDIAYAPSSVRNVVVDSQAKEITLTDSGMDGPFYCPERFRASRISYTHTYTQHTPMNTPQQAGSCSGWETLALPFDVQMVKHESSGVILPFTLLNGDFSSMKPFWLYELTAAGFTPGTQIKANTPYLISMPNNLKYADEYVLAGDVTFEALNTYVPVTETNIYKSDAYIFTPTLCGVERHDEVFAINNEEYPYFGYASGSIFVAGHRDVQPFEAYLSQSSQAARVPYIGISELSDGIESAMIDLLDNDEIWKVHSCDGVLYIYTGLAQRLPLYNVSGRLVRMLDLNPGVNTVRDLEPGVYFVKRDKVMITR